LTLRSESAAIHRLTILGRAGSDELGGLSPSDSPAVRCTDEERETLPVTSDQKGALSIARRRKR
jgi:hypothetical protein